jgi:hypothetical protein
VTAISEVKGHNLKAKLSWQVDNARCQVAATACVKGFQALRVEARAPSRGVIVDGVVSIRLGNVLIYLEDRDAMDSLVLAVNRAVEIQDRAFGPDLPPKMFAPKYPNAA